MRYILVPKGGHPLNAKDFLLPGLAAGVVAALLVSLPDVLFFAPTVSFTGWATNAGVLAPLGALWGLCADIFTAARTRKLSVWSIALRPDRPAVSLRVLFSGLLLIAGFKVLYSADYFFATAFHHPGLAAFALLLFLLIGAAGTAIVLPYLLRTLEAKLLRVETLRRVMPRPLIAACFPAGVFVGLVLPAIHHGPGATGPFGFVGMLRVAGGTALVSLLLLITLTAILTYLFKTHLKRFLPALFITTVLTALAGMFAAPAMMHRSPEAKAVLTDGRGAAAWAYRFAIRLTAPPVVHQAGRSDEEDTTQN